ncbi:MAG: aminotransferase class IV [Clostridia bacterium]|nr:aminotransferase class IV [Clostridia bacterium]
MENLGYYNGRYDRIERMSVPMCDRACYFGDGLFEVTYTRNHIPYSLSEHMDRMYASARELGIHIDLPQDRFEALIRELVMRVDADEQWVYWQISRGIEIRDYPPKAEQNANIWVMIRPMSIKNSYIPMRAITLEDKRALYCHMKTLNVLPAVLASAAVEQADVDEGVLLRGDRVTECIHANLSILRADGVIQTAPTNGLILPGVARSHLIRFAKKLGIPVEESFFSLQDLMAADEILVTSSGTLCRPIRQIDGKDVGGKAPETLKRLQDTLYEDFMKETTAKE